MAACLEHTGAVRLILGVLEFGALLDVLGVKFHFTGLGNIREPIKQQKQCKETDSFVICQILGGRLGRRALSWSRMGWASTCFYRLRYGKMLCKYGAFWRVRSAARPSGCLSCYCRHFLAQAKATGLLAKMQNVLLVFAYVLERAGPIGVTFPELSFVCISANNIRYQGNSCAKGDSCRAKKHTIIGVSIESLNCNERSIRLLEAGIQSDVVCNSTALEVQGR